MEWDGTERDGTGGNGWNGREREGTEQQYMIVWRAVMGEICILLMKRIIWLHGLFLTGIIDRKSWVLLFDNNECKLAISVL